MLLRSDGWGCLAGRAEQCESAIRQAQERETAVRPPQPISTSVIFSTACRGSCPPLCENCPHPVRVYGAPCKQSWCQELPLAVGPCWPATQLMFLQVECLGQSIFLCGGWAQVSLLR